MKCFLTNKSEKSMIFMDSMVPNCLQDLLQSLILRMLTISLKVSSAHMDLIMLQMAASLTLTLKPTEEEAEGEQLTINIQRLLQMVLLHTRHTLINLHRANTLPILLTHPNHQTISRNMQIPVVITLHLLILARQLKIMNSYHQKDKLLKRYIMLPENSRIFFNLI